MISKNFPHFRRKAIVYSLEVGLVQNDNIDKGVQSVFVNLMGTCVTINSFTKWCLASHTLKVDKHRLAQQLVTGQKWLTVYYDCLHLHDNHSTGQHHMTINSCCC